MLSASSAAPLVFYLPDVCTHTDTEGKPKLKTEEGNRADIYPWRYMSAQHLARDICFFQGGQTTCSQSYCKKPERRRVVVDGEERVEEPPRFGYPWPLLGFMTSNFDCMSAWQPWKRHISLARHISSWDVLRTYFSRDIVRTISLGLHLEKGKSPVYFKIFGNNAVFNEHPVSSDKRISILFAKILVWIKKQTGSWTVQNIAAFGSLQC